VSISHGIPPFNVASICVDSQIGAGLPFDTHLYPEYNNLDF
jgi:hypothetical protein